MIELVVVSSVVGGFILALVGYYISRLGLSTVTFSAAHAALAGLALSTILNMDSYILPIILTLSLGLVLGVALTRVSSEVMNNLSMMFFTFFNSITLLAIYLSNAVVLATTRVGGLLWGSPLAVTIDRFTYMVILTGIFITYFILFKSKLDAIVFDKKLAEAEGINTKLHSTVVIVFMCFAIVLMLEVVGGFLVFSLIYVPYIASVIMTSRADLQLVISCLFGMILTPIGVFLSFLYDIPIGSAIALTISLTTIATYVIKSSIRYFRNLRGLS
jgi:iron/zinc/copper transport system permease protein